MSSTPVFREYLESDRSEMAHIWSTVFQRGRPFEDSEQLVEDWETGYVAQLDGKTVAGFCTYNMQTAIGESIAPNAGVAAVAVLPEFRHRQIGGQMMEWGLAEMKRRGFLVASLYAFKDSYYRKFGYEVCGKRFQVNCPNHRMPKSNIDLPVREIGSNDIQQLDECYRSFARRRSGMNLRSLEQWKNRMGEKPPIIYAVGDPVEAYAWTSMEGNFWDDLRFGEIAWSSERGYRSLLGVMAGLGINRSSLIWYEPSDSPFIALHVDQGIKFSLERQIMYRVLDVPGALRVLPTCDRTEFSIRVLDRHFAENEGPWLVSSAKGKTEVAKSDHADIEISIQAFTQACLGEPSFGSLLANGIIRCENSLSGDAASRFFGSRPVACWDFF